MTFRDSLHDEAMRLIEQHEKRISKDSERYRLMRAHVLAGSSIVQRLLRAGTHAEFDWIIDHYTGGSDVDIDTEGR